VAVAETQQAFADLIFLKRVGVHKEDEGEKRMVLERKEFKSRSDVSLGVSDVE